MRIVFRISKATDTKSEYVIVNAFLLEQWLRERDSMLRYASISCPVIEVTKYIHSSSTAHKQRWQVPLEAVGTSYLTEEPRNLSVHKADKYQNQ